jgi:integrase
MPKTIKQLTNTAIQKSKPKDKPYKLYDGHGLIVLVRPSGTKSFQFVYKYGGKSQVLTIGKYGATDDKISLIEARDKCAQYRSLLQSGKDPAISYNDKKNSKSFKEVAEEWLLKKDAVQSYKKQIKQRFELYVYPKIGKHSISDVSILDIKNIIENMQTKNIDDSTKRVLQYINAIFSYAMMLEYTKTNPALNLKGLLKKVDSKNHAYLNSQELKEYWLKVVDDHTLSGYALQLLTLTFLRPGELLNLKWEYLNIEQKQITIPVSVMKMKENREDHIVPLSKQALIVIEKIRSYQLLDSVYLFPSPVKLNQPISSSALKKCLDKYTNRIVTRHGFRHIASSILYEKGFNTMVIEKQLAHEDENQIRAVYNKAVYLNKRKK